jgi:NDP-sugar pyrophosphorylase family protein|tara:strand:+ start:5657 stop:6484 length:828 start_codon:yes stop_codon:yes gene_type:complete
MKVIIPMAGLGQRFVDAGYNVPKPFIEVAGQKIIDRIVNMFDEDDEMIFICNERHLKTDDMESYLQGIKRGCTILSVPQHTKGPVFTVMPHLDNIRDDEEVIVCYCDNPYLWDYEDFKSYVNTNNVDGCIITHSGFHPHRLSSTYMAYCKTDGDSLIDIKEKEPYTDNHWEEHASTGTYYFRKGSYVKEYFKKTIDNEVKHTNGEYYVTLVYNLLVNDGLDVRVYDTDYVTVFGTPDEVKNYEAWNTIISGTQVKSEEDLIKSYNYWSGYAKNIT